MALYEAGDVTEARAAFEEGARLAPQEPYCAEWLAWLAYREKRWGEAERWYRHLSDVQPREAKWWVKTANSVRNQLRLSESAELLREALIIDPKNVTALVLLGENELRRGNYGTAEDLLVEAAQDHPNVSGPHYYLAVVYTKTIRWEDAITEARKAYGLALNPGYSDNDRDEAEKLVVYVAWHLQQHY